MKTLALALSLFSFSAFAQGHGCARYEYKPVFTESLKTVANFLDFSYEELCSHPRVLDVHVTTTKIYNQKQEPIPHVWVTLHYNEYSCQYFVNETNFEVTKSNCYNTF